jgi:hypothetical protein
MIRTVLDDLPLSVGGFVVEDEAGDYVIVMNARKSWEANRNTYFHELEHIASGDLYAHDEADYIEWVRHKE